MKINFFSFSLFIAGTLSITLAISGVAGSLNFMRNSVSSIGEVIEVKREKRVEESDTGTIITHFHVIVYEYQDSDGNKFTGEATANEFWDANSKSIPIEYLRDSPNQSRLKPSYSENVVYYLALFILLILGGVMIEYGISIWHKDSAI